MLQETKLCISLVRLQAWNPLSLPYGQKPYQQSFMAFAHTSTLLIEDSNPKACHICKQVLTLLAVHGMVKPKAELTNNQTIIALLLSSTVSCQLPVALILNNWFPNTMVLIPTFPSYIPRGTQPPARLNPKMVPSRECSLQPCLRC